ncbi:FHA domain-containing protein [Acanthopleuribacter pedis]|uniref:FHA domain-containing protein n=1 Tax=Acanthopleuribacter pedis TaxID=442870 RepID=A0A8J7QRN9_9BACT|nr:FHA domain-containing protein [Acanthopleuribacter pedis]MBO1322990.1 FHA domain-containing protein [Acanthopleuribacter pedis]
MTKLVQVVSGPLEGISSVIGEGEPLSLGRSSHNHMVLAYDPWISSSHGVLKLIGDNAHYMDMNSSNGSFVAGKKIAANKYVAVKDFLVLGSTVLRISNGSKWLQGRPHRLESTDLRGLAQHPLIKLAAEQALFRQSPIIGTIHLFLALLDSDRPEIVRFLKSLNFDVAKLRHRIEKLLIFEGKNRWINDFLVYQYKINKNSDTLVTPMVQDLMERIMRMGESEWLPHLKVILSENFNLLFPLMGIDDEDDQEDDPLELTDKVTLNPFDSEHKEIILPARFWRHFDVALHKSRVVMITGRRGSGKTTILKQCFHALPKVDIALFKSGEKRIYDPRLFSLFNSMEAFEGYYQQIEADLHGEKTIGIDHFDQLLKLMESVGMEVDPLMTLIKQRPAPTILALHSKLLPPLQHLFQNITLIHLDDYLGKVKRDILYNLIEIFERDTKYRLDDEARKFLRNQLLRRSNFMAVESFFDFCRIRLENLSFLYSELNLAAQRGRRTISVLFFQEMLDEWENARFGAELNVTQSVDVNATGKHRAVTERFPSYRNGEGGLVLRLERAMRKFLEKHFTKVMVTTTFDSMKELEGSDREYAVKERIRLLLECIDEAFVHWHRGYSKDMSPDSIANSVAIEDDAEVLWSEYSYRFQMMDEAFLSEKFFDEFGRVFLHRLQEIN